MLTTIVIRNDMTHLKWQGIIKSVLGLLEQIAGKIEVIEIPE